MTQATGTVASRLRERAQVFRQAADASRSGLERLQNETTHHYRWSRLKTLKPHAMAVVISRHFTTPR
ncbi:hypothetical protein AB0O34_20635 [Sphaerisporangium sp. NPDC088356]|uniref:hypothetical protein n=1 Tax=Sphaerisporangium sp. NPDC088356 TaxID=3154871 RepID=UPI00341A10B9